MISLQEGLLTEKPDLDIWSIREKLALASAVVRNGDQDWGIISQTCKEFAEPGRPQDWFSQMNCGLQYAALLEAAETPKRKRRNKFSNVDKKDDENETRSEQIVRVLTQERCAELQRSLAARRAKYLRLKEEYALIDSGQADDRFEEWAIQRENERKQKEIDAQNHALWLKKREEKNAQLKATGRLSILVPPMKRKIPVATIDLVPTTSANEPDLGHAINNQLRTTLNVDILAADADVPNQSIPTSPLLLSLLKTSSTISSTPQDDAQPHSDISQSIGSTRLVSQAQTSCTQEPASVSGLSSLYGMAGNIPCNSMLELARTTTEPNPKPGGVHHPQHQEMRVSKETESDEILEVVDIEQHFEFDEKGKSDALDLDLEEIIAELEATETDAGQQSNERVDFVDSSSDSLALLDSVLQSVDIVKVKSSDSDGNLFNNISEVSTDLTKEQLLKENDGANVVDGMSAVILNEINPIVVDTEKTNIQLSAKLNPRLDIPSEPLLNTMKAKSKADLQMTHNHIILSKEKLCSETLYKTEVTQLDRIQELNVQEILKKEMVSGLKPKREILKLRLSQKKSSQNLHRNSQNTLTNSKPLDKFDEMVNEGLPKQNPPKINMSKVKEICKTDHEINKEGKVCQNETNGTTRETLGSNELKLKQPENFSCNEIKAPKEEENCKLEEQKTDITTAEVQDINNFLPPDDSRQDTKEEYPLDAGVTKLTVIKNEIGTWPETSYIDNSLLHAHSSGHGSLMLTVDSVPNSPASNLTEDEKEYRAWKKAIMLVWSQINSHKYSSIFLKPISDDQAPHYSSRIKRPIDLLTIKKNIESGTTRSTNDFQRDVLLMFINAQMYNSSKHDVYNMAKIMQEDSIQLIRDFVETQKMVQSANETTALRRETRTTGSDTQRRDDSDESRTPLSFKRKRVSDAEKSAPKKPKYVDSPNQ